MINLNEHEKSIPVGLLQAKATALNLEANRLKSEGLENSSYGKALNNLLFRLRLYEDVDAGTDSLSLSDSITGGRARDVVIPQSITESFLD